MHSEAAFKCKVCVEDQLCPKDGESGMERKKTVFILSKYF